MKSFRDKLLDRCGAAVVSVTEAEIRSEAVERYGSYIDFRQEDEANDQSFDFGAASPGPLVHAMAGHPRSPV
jgi:hypothetical protein